MKLNSTRLTVACLAIAALAAPAGFAQQQHFVGIVPVLSFSFYQFVQIKVICALIINLISAYFVT